MYVVSEMAFVVILLLACFVDLRSRRIPNRATALAYAIGLAGILIQDPARLPVALLVSAMVASPLLLAAMLRPAGMGMGDVKLMAAIGLYLGWAAVGVLLLTLLAATVVGAAVALLQGRSPAGTGLPLAPFMTIATLPPLIALIGDSLH